MLSFVSESGYFDELTHEFCITYGTYLDLDNVDLTRYVFYTTPPPLFYFVVIYLNLWR